MYQAKFRAKYFSLLVAKRRIIYEILQITTFIIATSGVIAFRFDANYTGLAIIIVAALLAISYVLPAFIPSTETLLKIENTVSFYSKQFINFEKLWNRYRKNDISESDISNEIFELMNQNAEQEKIIDSFLKTNNEKIWTKSKESTDTYFQHVYKTA
jgi:hypothetical protein